MLADKRSFDLKSLIFFTLPSVTFTQIFSILEKPKSEE